MSFCLFLSSHLLCAYQLCTTACTAVLASTYCLPCCFGVTQFMRGPLGIFDLILWPASFEVQPCLTLVLGFGAAIHRRCGILSPAQRCPQVSFHLTNLCCCICIAASVFRTRLSAICEPKVSKLQAKGSVYSRRTVQGLSLVRAHWPSVAVLCAGPKRMGFLARVNRDLKLDNTLLDGALLGPHRPPMIKLCDFGFAKHWGPDSNMYTHIG